MRSSNIVKATSVSGDIGVEVAFNGVQVTYLDVLPAMYVLPHEPVHCPYFGIELLQVRHDESDVRSPPYPFWSQQQFKTANYQHHQKVTTVSSQQGVQYVNDNSKNINGNSK